MNPKTPAEQQLEHLKKLKAQQGSRPARPPRAVASAAAAAEPGGLKIKVLRKKAQRRIPLSEPGWRQLKEQGIETGLLKLNQGLGDWAVELLLNLPAGLQNLAPEAKQELFAKIKDWAASRGMK